jgi:hypothetical protein
MAAAGFVALAAPASAWATAPTTFGHGARSAGLSQSDVADPDAASAAVANAALAARRGFRLRLGYAYGGMNLTLDGADAGVRPVSGVDAGAQLGFGLARSMDMGFAIALHFPDAYLAKIGFRPATEPQFIRYESNLQRASFDMVTALRFGPISLGGGVAMAVDFGGQGADVTMGQNAGGTYGDADVDITLPYRPAPIVGLHADLGRVALGATFRGPLAVDLNLDAISRVALIDNPLNGTTTVKLHGASGYDPATVHAGVKVGIWGGLSVLWAMEYAAYSQAPPPVADVVMDIKLGTTPSQREAHFIEPRLRDTLSPRFGIEFRRPDRPEERAARSVPRKSGASKASGAAESQSGWALRAGYVLSPSPVPRQTGFTSYADATRHGMSLGGGIRFGHVAGVDLSADVAGQVHVLAARLEQKKSDALPHARYEVAGRIYYGALTLEAMW